MVPPLLMVSPNFRPAGAMKAMGMIEVSCELSVVTQKERQAASAVASISNMPGQPKLIDSNMKFDTMARSPRARVNLAPLIGSAMHRKGGPPGLGSNTWKPLN
jgi:hypothetical protein